MDCNHDSITVTLDNNKILEKIECNDCNYLFSIPEFRKRTFKEINVQEKA